MAHRLKVLALAMIFAAPAAPAATAQTDLRVGAPPGSPDTQYCMRVELTGNIVDPVRCWTREQWADQGVDIDEVWAKEGVAVREPFRA